MKYKCFAISYNEENTVYTIGKKTKTLNIKCGSVIVNSEGEIQEIHIYAKQKDDSVCPIEDKYEGIKKWIISQDLEYTPNSKIFVRRKHYDHVNKKRSKSYILWSEYIQQSR